MRLVSLEVRNWRGLDHVELTGLAPDLNLVVGPNESGKSRLFEALHFGLFERYKGESEDKRALRTWGGAESPSVTIAFEARGTVWTLKKQFLKQAHARLEGGGRTWTDDDAEAQVRDLWGTRPIQGRRGIEQFLGLWPLLWVRQGFATSAPHADFNDDSRGRLRDALASQVNEVAAGPHGERIVARAERERERYWTATWKDTGELAAARVRKADADAAVNDARSKRAEAHGAADELGQLARDLAALETRAGAQRKIVAESAALVERAREMGERAKAQKNEVARLRAENELAERSLRAHRDLEERLKKLDTLRAAEATALTELGAESAAIGAREAAEATAVTLAEKALEDAHAAHLQARRRAAHDDAARRAEAARGALERARGHEARVVELKEALATLRVDDTQIKRLRKVNEAFARASSALAAASARVTMRATRDLVVDGAPLGEGEERSWACDAPATIVIAGVARIEVRPGGAELDAHRDAERDARRALDARLSELGVATLAEAEETYARRTGLDAQLAQAEVLLREAAPNGARALEDELRAREADVAAVAEHAASAPSLAEADETLRTVTDRVARARAARDALKEGRFRVRDQIARREQAIEQIDQQRKEARRELEALPPAATLTEASAGARRAWLDADELARAIAEEITRAGASEAPLRLEQDQSALRSVEAEVAKKSARRVLLEATLEVRGAEDLHDRVQRAEADAEAAEMQLRNVESRAAAARALVEALRDARREAQERLLAPVLERVHPYLQALLPGARLRMDENWSVLGLEEKNQEEDFEALSGGAKEQVSILVRLALAEVLGQGDSLPIVLDDSLVNTDDERHADMLRILYRASRKQQIILFSCHDVAWGRLGESQRYELKARRAR